MGFFTPFSQTGGQNGFFSSAFPPNFVSNYLFLWEHHRLDMYFGLVNGFQCGLGTYPMCLHNKKHDARREFHISPKNEAGRFYLSHLGRKS